MGNEEPKKAQVISFLSGKGGVGKTSVAIGVSYLLNDAGFKVLLIDFDFATNGASYFYKHLYSSSTEIDGIYELISEIGPDFDKVLNSPSFFLPSVKEGLNFIPSRVNFSKKLPLRDSVVVEEKELKLFLLSLTEFSGKKFDFIIIDNQAGSNLTSKVSASVSDKVIIVSELDPISSDAVDTLLIQIGEAFPEYRRHLINKLDVRERKDYKELSTLFQSMNRLPPLPFDFEVRSAFASRQVPIDVNKPTTFLVALFNTVKAFLPEYKEQIEGYGEKILSKFNQYQDKVDSLLDRKKELEEEIDILIGRKEKRGSRLQMLITILALYFGMVVTASGLLSETWQSEKFLFIAMGIAISMGGIGYLFISRQQYKEKMQDIEREKINAELSEINKEIDRYKSLMLTRTKEFLLYFEKPEKHYGSWNSSIKFFDNRRQIYESKE